MRSYIFYETVCFLFLVILACLEVAFCFFSCYPDVWSVGREDLLTIGMVLLGAAAFLFTLFYFSARKGFYRVIAEPQLQCTIDSKVPETFLRHFFDGLLPVKNIPFRTLYRKGILEIMLDFSDIPLRKHRALIHKIEFAFAEHFEKVFGSSPEILLTIAAKKS